MNVKLHNTDEVRIATGMSNNFIDVRCGGSQECIEVAFSAFKRYVEIRCKENYYCAFFFESLRDKDLYDFGYWSDGEVVFCTNL